MMIALIVVVVPVQEIFTGVFNRPSFPKWFVSKHRDLGSPFSTLVQVQLLDLKKSQVILFSIRAPRILGIGGFIARAASTLTIAVAQNRLGRGRLGRIGAVVLSPVLSRVLLDRLRERQFGEQLGQLIGVNIVVDVLSQLDFGRHVVILGEQREFDLLGGLLSLLVSLLASLPL